VLREPGVSEYVGVEYPVGASVGADDVVCAPARANSTLRHRVARHAYLFCIAHTSVCTQRDKPLRDYARCWFLWRREAKPSARVGTLGIRSCAHYAKSECFNNWGRGGVPRTSSL